MHLFYEYIRTKVLLGQLQQYLETIYIIIPKTTTLIVAFGFSAQETNNKIFNFILLICQK